MDFVIALANGEHGVGAFVEPLVIILILVANGEAPSGLISAQQWLAWGRCSLCIAQEQTKYLAGNQICSAVGDSNMAASRHWQQLCKRLLARATLSVLCSPPDCSCAASS